jgi:nitrite reductase/ring-hydroxylating ferredoxin subunit
VDRSAGRYVVRTGPPAPNEGEGAPARDDGPTSEIWTSVAPESDELTRIHVEFRVPPLPAEQLRAIGRVYVEVYTRLWDEDEEMMCERALRLRELERARHASEVDLGHLDELREKLPLDVEFAGRPHRVVELDGQLVAHSLVCPHKLGPLFSIDGDAAKLECPWHGYAFDARSGASCDGRGLHLSAAPRVAVHEETGRCSLVPA